MIDFLPKRVSEQYAERFLEVEEYFLQGNEWIRIKDSFVRILLKLQCHCSFRVYNATEDMLDLLSEMARTEGLYIRKSE